MVDRAAAAEPVRPARPGLPAVRAAPTPCSGAITRLTNSGSSCCCSGTARSSSGTYLRRSATTCRGRADRVELRHRARARLAVPDHGRHRHDDLRRPVDHERGLLEHARSGCRRSTIGTRNFVGNNIAFPAGARTGENCLLATKVMVPIDGPVRENVGLLGSPAFEIPRSVSARRRVRLPERPGRGAPPAARQEPAQRREHRHRAAAPVRCSSSSRASLIAAIALDLLRASSARSPSPAACCRSWCSTSSTRRAAGAGRAGLPGADARGSARSTTRTSGGTSGSGSSTSPPIVRRHPVQER